MTKTLNLTLKKKWFDMIASGEKKEEYREYKSYWAIRLMENVRNPDGSASFIKGLEVFKTFDQIQFRNGYAKDAPILTVECNGIEIKEGRPEWGANKGQKYFVIKLGEILKSPNA